MADYILNVAEQTSKLDWAMPFQRTGAFPLDRSALFSSLADATAYAKGDGSDERQIGGTSYAGQIISVLDGETISAYLISKDRSLLKLASTTTSGDLASDVASLQTKLDTLTESVGTLETTLSSVSEKADANETAINELKVKEVYTKTETDTKISEAVAKAPHMQRKVVENVEAIEAEMNTDEALNIIYMVPSGLLEEGNKYYEYIVIDDSGVRRVEKVGSWEVDLSAYAKTVDVNEKLALKADQSTVDTLSEAVDKKADASTTLAGYGITDAYTKGETDTKIADAVKSATGGESAATVLAELNAYKTSNDAKVGQNTTDIQALQEVGAEKNTISTVSDELAVDEDRKLSVVSIGIAKVTNLQDELDKLATKEEVQIVVGNVNNLTTRMDTVEQNITELQSLLTWNEINSETIT